MRVCAKKTAKISPDFKPGGSGYAHAKVVKDGYMQAWERSTNAVAPDTITKVKVTVGKVGKVLSAVIVKFSGSEQMDKSVQKMLDDV
jgi:TonB C terminal